MPGRSLHAALALSLAIHAALMASPAWRLPSAIEPPEPSPALDARLAPLRPRVLSVPLPGAPPARKPRPAPVREAPAQAPAKQAPAGEAAAPAVAEPPPSQAVPEPVPSAAAPAAAAETPAAADIPLPRQGRIRFLVTRGEGELGTPLGQSVHVWRHDGMAYSLRTQTETTGLMALFRSARIVQVSEGRVGAAGLEPREFRVERNGQPAEGARFDWSGMKLALGADGNSRELALARGAQDLLSQLYQVGMMETSARREMMVATGKAYGRYTFETVGEELLATRFGALRTLRVKTLALPGEQAMELWLAADYRNLPLRIVYRDRKGDVFEQNAVEFEIDGAKLAERTE